MRSLVALLLSFLLVASGFYGANSLAQSGEPWDGNPANGDVEVEGSVSSLNLRAGESKSYRIRLTRQPKADNWWVRIFVNGANRAGGYYPPGNREDAMISWVPSVGWEFDVDNTNDAEQPTRWRTITFKAHKNITTPIKIMHEVWANNRECPIHERGKITISSEPTPPDAPVLRAAANGKSQIDLSWDEPDDNGASISRYTLQVSDDGASGWTNLTSSLAASATSHSHTRLSPGTRKYYRIQAHNSKGAGGWSNVADATTEADVPGAPVLRATPNGETQIDLSWDEPAKNGADITRYELQVSDDGSNWTDLVSNYGPSVKSHNHTGLSAGTKKYYQIRAYNSVGFGPWRAKSATTQAGVPDKPVLNAAADGETEIDLTWTAPADNGEDITRYELQVSDNGTSGWSGLGGRISASAVSHTHTNLSPGTQKYYQIRAHNSLGPSAWSDVVDATTQMGVPGKPVLSATANGKTQIDLSWSEPADNGASISRYELQESDDGNDWTGLTTIQASLPRTHNDTGLSPGTRKYYQIRAHNSQGPGPWSDPKNATTQADVPDKPVLTATANGQTKIDLTWEEPEDNGASISRYELQVSDDGNSGWTNLATSISSTARSYTHSNLSPGTTKHYRILARNSQGPSEWSDPKNATTRVGVPDAPVLRATANGQTIINLSWDEPANNGMDITRYELEVSDDGNSWTPLDRSLPALDRSHSHTDLSPGTRKYYQIRAHNDVGPGEWSTPKSATTQRANNGGIINPGTNNDGNGGNGGNGGNSGNSGNGENSGGSNGNEVKTSNVPDKPVLSATANGQTRIDLSWTAPAGNGAAITHYELQVSDDGNSGWSGLGGQISASSTSYPHAELSAGTTKHYRIRAHNSQGSGAWSDVASATTGVGVPDKPVLSATTNGQTRIDLSWTAPAGNGAAITHYELQVSDDGNSGWSGLGGQISASSTSYPHAELSAGTTKHYRIRAHNSQGSGAWSDVASATTGVGVPDKPVLSATANGQTRIDLSWTAPAGNGAAITHYELQVSDDGNSGWSGLEGQISASSTSYPHAELSAGTTKHYRIRAHNSQGSGAWSDVASATTGVGVPDKPVLSATANGQTRIDLSWTAPAGNGAAITHYELQVSDDGNSGWSGLGGQISASSTSYPHAELSAGTTKHYRIRAHNLQGSGAWSDVASATTGVGVPDKPVLSATANGQTRIDLSWAAPAGNGAAITHYELQVSDDGNSGWSGLGGQISASSTSYPHAELSAGTTKHYRIRAHNSQGSGAWSDVASATTGVGVPDKPVLSATANGQTRIDLSWTAPAGNGAAITHYELQVSDDGNSGWSGLGGQISASSTSYPHAELSAGTTKHYRIRAHNLQGSGAWSDVASATTGVGVPDKPVLSATANGQTRIDLSWAAPAGNGAAITHYELQVSDDGNSGWSGLGGQISASSTSYPHAELSAGTTKHYRIRAHNSQGSGAWSDVASATTGVGVPDKPVLSATANGQTRIDLSWAAPAGNGAAITHYELQVSDDGNSGWSGLGGQISASSTSYPHAELSAGTTKHYRIRAHNSQGSGAWSDVASATTGVGVPDKPVLSATANGQTRIDLSWAAPAGNGAAITHYELQVSDDGNSGWSGLGGQISASSTSYPHAELSAGTTKHYRIRAHNSQGSGAWSDVVSATTQVGLPNKTVLSATANGQTQIDLSWAAPPDNGAGITRYELEVSDDGASGWNGLGGQISASSTSYPHTGLSAGTTKHYRIRAYNSQGHGAWSDVVSATTEADKVKDNSEGMNDWLTRFARTVASQAVETIESRLKSPSMRQASQVTLAGQEVNFFDEDNPEYASASRLASHTLGFGGLAGNDPAADHRKISMSDLMLASSFHLISTQNAENGPGTNWTAWGRGSRTSFYGDKNNSSFKGDVTTGTLGGDFEWGRTMVGIALTHTLGEGYFSIDGRRNDVEARLSGAYPYMRYTVSEYLTVWSMFGFGNGEYAQTEQGGDEKIETDISTRMGAFGFRSSLIPLARQIGYDLAVKADVMVVEIEAEEVRDKLLPVDTNTNRFRLLLEGSREYKVGHGASITPSLAMGLRYDKGDAEEGGGIEFGGGFRFFVPSLDMVIDVNAHSLLLHEERRFSDAGVSGSVHLTWGTQEKGLSVQVGSSWGDIARGAERLWSQASVEGLGSGIGGAHLEAEVGYGMDAPGDGTITPYAGLTLADRGSETYRLGGRLRVGDLVSLRLEGDRRERVGGKSSHGIALLGSIRW